MNAAELEQLIDELRIAGTDSDAVEVKSAGHRIPKTLRETLSAFANGSGGTVILGLSEAYDFSPVSGFDPKRIQDAAAGMCANDLTPPLRASIKILPFRGAAVVVISVPELQPRDKPCYVKTAGQYAGSYIRTGDGDRRLTYYEVDRLIENRTQPDWDKEPVLDASIDDLKPDLIAGLLAKERLQAPHIFGKKTDIEALKSLHVLRESTSGTIHPSLGGLLALGTHPQFFFPRLYVSFAAYPGMDKTAVPSGLRFLDSATFLGPIPAMVEDAVKRVTANMRTGGAINGAFRKDLPDYPPVAVREAVTNALMHRDYSPEARGGQVQVNMYADRLEIVNPGGLFGAVTVQTLKEGTATPGSRNAILSNILESVPFPEGGYVAENRGSGYQEIKHQLAQNLLSPPVPHDHLTQFSLTFLRRTVSPAKQGYGAGKHGSGAAGSSSKQILEYLANHRTATSRDLAEAAGIGIGGARKAINTLIEQNLIERTEPVRSPKQRYRLKKKD